MLESSSSDTELEDHELRVIRQRDTVDCMIPPNFKGSLIAGCLISALSGLERDDEDGRLSLFAVGDDDQNIYSFAGASVEFIRRLEQDYSAKPAYLTDNYRSTAHTIAVANQVIEPAHNRRFVALVQSRDLTSSAVNRAVESGGVPAR